MAKRKTTHLILDSHRGVYWGEIVETLEGGNAVKLKNARHCYYFPVPNHKDKGVYSLASLGPQPGSKIGPLVNMVVRDVTKMVECTAVAQKAWESAQWGS